MARFTFQRKVALITGGSRGLGFEIARLISRQGGKVAILARDANELRHATAELRTGGGEALAVRCDLLDREQIQSVVRQTVERFGRIDILINNAGIIEIGPLEHMCLEDFDRAMRLHFWAPFMLIMQVVPHMQANGGGRIVNISSIGGRIAVPHMAPYSASKFALTGFSDAIRAELSRDNILVTTVTPGMMRTGSQVHAKFKGNYSAEYRWFSLSNRLPLASISVERAARKIVAACRRGKPALVMPWTARFLIATSALFPSLTGYLMIAINKCLPSPVSQDEDGARTGADVRRGK
jgi:NAD(P)-dependent dehydrogenase (short-subunit alcohol dehydrogenase family)